MTHSCVRATATALVAAFLTIGTACRPARASRSMLTRDIHAPTREGEWLRVFTDSAFAVSLDSSRVEKRPDGAYLLHFETRWARPHQTQAPSPFNREAILTLLRCAPLEYRTVRVSVYLDDGPLVAVQGGTVADAERTPWKAPTPGSADESSFAAACSALADHTIRPR